MTDALYTRVSTADQKHDPQLLELRTWCKAYRVKPLEFSDTLSGSKFTRTGLEAMMNEVRAKKVRRVIVWKLDRLGRSLAQVLVLIKEIQLAGAGLVCTSQGIDTTSDSATATLTIHILGAVAEFERSLISERTKAGIEVARANGKQIGRAPTVQVLAPEVKRLLKRGLTMEQVAQKLKIGRGSVWRMAHKK